MIYHVKEMPVNKSIVPYGYFVSSTLYRRIILADTDGSVSVQPIYMSYCNVFRPNARRRSELLANMAHVTVPPSVKWLKKWKSPSTQNTLARSAVRLVSRICFFVIHVLQRKSTCSTCFVNFLSFYCCPTFH